MKVSRPGPTTLASRLRSGGVKLVRGFRSLIGDPSRVYDIYWISDNMQRFAKQKKIVSGPFLGDANLVTPMESGRFTVPSKNRVPAITVQWIENASLLAINRFNAVVLKRRFLISERHEPAPWDVVGPSPGSQPRVVWQRSRLIAVSRVSQTVKIGSALYIGARAPYNYYHWLINALPSLFVAGVLARIPSDVPVLVPANVAEIPNLMAPLRALSGQREILLWDLSTKLEVGRCAIIDPPPVYDTPLSRDQLARLPLSIHLPVMRMYSEFLIDMFNPTPRGTGPTRLFLARPRLDKRVGNQDELIALAREHGFTPYYADRHSFSDQVATFRRARFIIGPAGAAFTNLIFCSPGAKALHWQQGVVPDQNAFANLAAVSGAECFSLGISDVVAQTSLTKPGILPPEKFKGALRRLLRG